MNMSNHDREHSPDMEEALKALLQSPAPSEAFVDRLEQQLRDRGAALSERGLDHRSTSRSRLNPLRRFDMLWQRSRAAAFNIVALAALLVFVVGLMALFSNANPSTISRGTPTPAGPMLILQGSIAESIGPVGQREVPVSVRAALPQVSDRVPLYAIKAAFDKPSAELARSWAEKLGLKAVRLYQDTTQPDATYIAQGDDGRIVRVGPGAQLVYQANVESLFVPARSSLALDPQTAQAAAEAFLNSIADLFVIEGNSTAKITFRIEPSPHQVPETRVFGMTFAYTAMIDGLPVLSRGTPGTITVDADGRIRTAVLTPLRVTPTGNEVAVQPVNTVVQAFLNGDPAVLRGSGWSSTPTESATQSPLIHTREPSYTVGDNITLKGGIQHWVAVDGGADLYFLSALGTQSFILEGEGLNVSSLGVEIKGRIAGQVRSGTWRIAVASIQPIEAGPQAYADWTGTLRRQADGTWLETDGGQKYLLPDPPTDLPDGTHVEAPGAVIDNGNGSLRLEWQAIYVSPQSSAAGRASGSGVVSSVERQVVVPEPTIVPPFEPTQVVTAAEEIPLSAVVPPPVYPNGAPYSTGIFQSVTSGASGSPITPTLPAWWTYKPGDDVTLEGQLSAQGYRILSASPSDPSATPAPSQTVLEAHLLVMKDENKPDEMVPITLVGDQVNLDLIRLGGLHVRVQGRLLSSDEAVKQYSGLIDKGLTGFALEVTHYEKTQPAETKDIFSGRIRVETFDGREAAIFSDTLSGKEYVLADSLTITYTLEMYRQQAKNGATVHAIGVLVADQTFAGRPVLRLLETQSSSSNSDEALKALRAELDNPIHDIGPANEGPQDVIIDRVELAYVFQTPPLRAPEGFASSPTQLVYELTGHSSDGRFTVTYDLEATALTTPAVPTIEPPLIPPLTPAPTEPVRPTPAPTPTPGEPVRMSPTTVPLAQPLTTEEQAIEQVLKIDANIAIWDHPWSKDTLRLEPDRITLTAFPSRTAEAAGSGEGFSPEVDANAGAVWRVTIKGAVQLKLLGAGVDQTTKYDGVTYVISQRHGGLLSVSAGKPMSALP